MAPTYPPWRSRRRSVRSLSTGLLLCLSLLATSIWVAVVPASGGPRAAPPPASVPLTVGTYRVHAPAGWPVIDLAHNTAACYRVDRHAAFVGHPGDRGQCPPHLVGRTETVLIEPLDNAVTTEAPIDVTAAAGQVPALPALARMTHQLRVEVSDARVVVTITWSTDFPTVANVLASGRLVAPGSGSASGSGSGPATTSTPSTTTAPSTIAPPTTASWKMTAPSMKTVSWKTPAVSSPTAKATTSAAAQADPPLAGKVVSGQGFDSCSLPPASQMGTLRNVTGWTFAGFYLGGVNAACPNTSLGLSWVNAVTSGGWGLAPLWVGLQAPTSQCSSCALLSSGSAAAQGANEAVAAVTVARTMGMGASSPIYYDMEAYVPGGASGAVISFLSAWTNELHRLGYMSGVYSSAASGISDLVATYNTTLHPDLVWIANWNGAATTADRVVPASYWSNHQRLHQFASSSMHSPISLPGFRLQYDSDVADGQVAGNAPAEVNPLAIYAAGKYVNFLYKLGLGRPVDSIGVATFVPEIVAGVPRSSVVQAILYSNEGLRHQVTLDYLALLGRFPDPGGENYWTWILALSHRNDVVRAELLGSAEFYRRAGNTIGSFVGQLYRLVLGRAADSTGFSHWTAQIARGRSRTNVALMFFDSVEGSRRDVTAVYGIYVHRLPDSTGLAHYTSVYRQTFQLSLVEIAIGSSDECFSVAQRSS